MLTSYNSSYFNSLKKIVKDFNVDYLKQDNPFLKNYVFLDSNNVIGLISYSLIYDRIELEYIWVKEEYRKSGIASQMMDLMFKENVKNITLEVRKSNVGAICLYKKYGFVIASLRHNYYGDEDAYLMIREMM